MKIIFLGCTRFSEYLLTYLLKNNVKVTRIFTIPEKFSISYNKNIKNYNYSDLTLIAKDHSIPIYYIDSGKNKKLKDYEIHIKEDNPDLILVLGWYYMVPKSIRDSAKNGAWGIHASILPKYAGGAPLVWAMINGEKKVGVTLFKLSDGIDDGDIIDQEEIEICRTDTIAEVYNKATETSAKILLNNIKNIDKIKYTPQLKNNIEILPQRKPEDGEIDLSWDKEKIFNFIRAQVSPYPGAFIKLPDGRKLIIEKVKIIDEMK